MEGMRLYTLLSLHTRISLHNNFNSNHYRYSRSLYFFFYDIKLLFICTIFIIISFCPLSRSNVNLLIDLKFRYHIFLFIWCYINWYWCILQPVTALSSLQIQVLSLCCSSWPLLVRSYFSAWNFWRVTDVIIVNKYIKGR